MELEFREALPGAYTPATTNTPSNQSGLSTTRAVKTTTIQPPHSHNTRASYRARGGPPQLQPQPSPPQQFTANPIAHPPQHQQSIDEDELLALLSADTFSLESNRDRALLELSSFLKVSIPGASSPPNQFNPPANSQLGFNGWPIQQTISSASTSASSGYSNAYSPPTVHPTPYGTPVTAPTALPPISAFADLPRPTSRAPQRSPLAAPSHFQQFPATTAAPHGGDGGAGSSGLGMDLGCPRAPAVSRERERARGQGARPRAASLVGRGGWGPGAEEDDVMEAEEEGSGQADVGMDEEEHWRAQQAAYGQGSHPGFT